MKASVILKKLFTGACVYYTVVSLAVLIASALLGGDLNGTFTSLNYLLFFPFGLALSGAGILYRNSGLPYWGRLLLHFLITLAAFFCFLWLPSGANSNASTVLTMLLLLSIAYWVICLIVILARKRFRSFKEE